jgi:para-nitrobenzyl esterase
MPEVVKMASLRIEVKTTSGILRGIENKGILGFLGVPFAEPPVGSRRFQPPQPVSHWPGVRDATTFSASPAQPQSPMLKGEPSEDSLYLNLWTPAESASPLAVVVWIYGGGFQGGTASSAEFSGEHLVSRGNVIVVTLNYRVGLLGFGALPESDNYPSSTNLGVRDVMAGLHWVRDNIAKFGGDPENVTVMGQSAGAFIAAALLASHQGKGLFHKLILLSGGTSRIVPDYRVSAITSAAIDFLGGNESDLVGASAESLFEAQEQVLATDIGVRNSTEPNALGVVLDSTRRNGLLFAHPMEVILSGERSNLAILVGVSEAEIAAFRRWSSEEQFAPASFAALANEVASWGVDLKRAQGIVEGYRVDSQGAENSLALTREMLLTDWIYRLPAARLAQNHAVTGGASWLLEFRGTPSAPMGHGDEVSALFDNLATSQEVEKTFRDDFQNAVIAFARNGNPGWAKHSVARGETQVLGAKSYLEDRTFEEVLQLWSGIERP